MPQPLGSLVSASIDKDGKQIPEAAKYFSSNLVIFDPGFGTMDDYTVKQGNVVGNGETFSNLGMHEVFERTCKDIRDIYGVTLQVPELINKLDSGTVYITDRRKMKRVEKEFTDFLTRNSKQVCEEAVEQKKNFMLRLKKSPKQKPIWKITKNRSNYMKIPFRNMMRQ